MDDVDVSSKIEVIPDHFQASSTPTVNSANNPSPLPSTDSNTLRSQTWTRRGLRSAAFMLNLLNLRGLTWSSSADGQEKVILTAAELESLRSELADLEEREAHFKAQLEHIDEILRSARLSGYLYIRTRWEALPGEPPPIDDTDVNDWLPRFVVFHGPCIFFYLNSTDLSPQDSTLLADVIEVGMLPEYATEDKDTRYCFYILTQQGLRYECSHASKTQVDSWVSALRAESKLDLNTKVANGSCEYHCDRSDDDAAERT